MNRQNKLFFLLMSLSLLFSVIDSHATNIINNNFTTRLTFHFRLGGAMLLYDYKNNTEAIDSLTHIISLNSNYKIDEINIIGSASPEGNETVNSELARKRAEAIQSYIRWKYNHIKDVPIKIDYSISNWDEIIKDVESDIKIPNLKVAISILKSDLSNNDKTTNLKNMCNDAYLYLCKNILPKYREALTCVVHYQSQQVKNVDVKVLPSDNIQTITDTQKADTIKQELSTADAPLIENPSENVTIATPEKQIVYTKKPLFALKTNLLFDAATLLNIELEIAIGKRWSLAGEVMFPWWLSESKQNCIQILSGNLEGRYWIGNMGEKSKGKRRDVLTGWFAGLYMGGGMYDLEWNKKGYQGEFFIAAGISGGYTHAIGKNLRMEYSLGVGYMRTNYRHYEAIMDDNGNWHLKRQNSGQFSWIGPTRLKVSLVWLINLKKKEGIR